jgi:tRNA A-37 threonylcarbamoyl transferase component Bud32
MLEPRQARERDRSGTLRVASEALASLDAAADRRVVGRALWIGLWTWPSFTALDWYMCFVAYPQAPFRLFVVYRVIVELLLLAAYRASLSETVNVRRLFRGLTISFSAAAFTIALMAIHLGGIRSPYMHGISIAALVWAALIPTHWRRGLPTFMQIGFSFPIVMGLGALVSPAARAAWITRDALIVFVSNYVFVLSSSILGIILSHLVWSAQQRARKMGSYELEERLGQGGMGEVWRARHNLLARRAAIKLIRPEALGNDEHSRRVALARFEREAQATASLRSPHTIDLYDFGISDTGSFYYVMELLVGRDMQTLVRDFGQQPPERALYLLEQVCESLAEAHAVGLVHRDIKPSNIYICREGLRYDFVKVLDFGLARNRRPEAAQQTLQTGKQVTGTPAYMAPEIIMGAHDADPRADVYALGCVAYFLLTGHLVFEEETPMRTLLRHVEDAPVPPSQRAEIAVPLALDALIMRCLEKDPASRPRDAQAVLKLIRACAVGAPWNDDLARAWWEAHLPDLCTAVQA